MAFMLIVIGAILLLMAIHSFITYPLSLLAIRAMRRPKVMSSPRNTAADTFAVCVCAYNEQSVIQKKAENLLELRKAIPNLDILIYVDAASDRTAPLLAPYSDRFKIHVAKERNGKTHGMNLLVSKTEASIVIFTDANVMLDAQSLLNLNNHFADPEVGCVCGHLLYTNPKESTTATTGSLYWRFEEWVKGIETATGSVIGADGSLFAIRRELHAPPPDSIIDDLYVSLSILCKGYRVVQATDIYAYEESVTSQAEEFRRKIRIACQAFNVHRLLWSSLRQLDALTLYKYVSHKLLRWFSIYFLAAAGPFFAAGLLFAGNYWAAMLVMLIPWVIFVLGKPLHMKPFPFVWDLLAALVAAGWGIWRSIRGDAFQTWTPSASIRQ